MLNKDKLNKLEQIIINTNEVLGSLIKYQVSLETQLQELIKSNNSPIIPIKSASKIDFIPVSEILYCSADLAYTQITTLNNNKILATKTINEFEDHLSCYSFFRISKSLLVNIKHIHSYNRKNSQILMHNKEILDVARRRKTEFLSAILDD